MQVHQNELFEVLTAAVQEFGGFVDKFVGDALVALFGAPYAHEDDPERALRAALAMQERTARLDARWRGRAGLPLTLHLGINTGPAVAGGHALGRSFVRCPHMIAPIRKAPPGEGGASSFVLWSGRNPR
jgi:class 3 adenylate cyclase